MSLGISFSVKRMRDSGREEYGWRSRMLRLERMTHQSQIRKGGVCHLREWPNRVNRWLEALPRWGFSIALVVLSLIVFLLLDCLRSTSGFVEPFCALATAVATVTLCCITARYVRITKEMSTQGILPIIALQVCRRENSVEWSVRQSEPTTQITTFVSVHNAGRGAAISLELLPWIDGQDNENGWVQAWWEEDDHSIKNLATIVSTTDQIIPSQGYKRIEVTIDQYHRPNNRTYSPIRIRMKYRDGAGNAYKFECEAHVDVEGGWLTAIRRGWNWPE